MEREREREREQWSTCKNFRLSLGSWTDWCGSFMVVFADEEELLLLMGVEIAWQRVTGGSGGQTWHLPRCIRSRFAKAALELAAGG